MLAQLSPARVMTCGVAEIASQVDLGELLAPHHLGDWGAVCAEDKAINNRAVKNGDRILSAYPIDASLPCKGYGENCLWIITEADRSVTTILLPDEY